MSEQHVYEPTEHLTFEKVWAMFQETAERFKETDKKFQETDKKFQETIRENAEHFKETDRAVKEASRIVGDLSNKLGIVVEHLVLANIKEKFNALGYEFTKAGPSVLIEDFKKRIITQIDAMLENGEFALAVEVKTQLNVSHVDEHVERMEKLRRYADDRGDTRKFLGAVAGAIVADNVKVYALKKGFYVIRQSGDTVTIENPQGFEPKTW
jgi:hypothetical protein